MAWSSIAGFLGIFLISTLACFVGAYVWLKLIEKYRSNFVPVDQYDSLIRFPADFSAEAKIIKKRYLAETNIYETYIDEEICRIYLVKKRSHKLSFYICSSDDKRLCITDLFKSKLDSCEKVTLPLSFEGKPIGNAELIEVSAPRTN